MIEKIIENLSIELKRGVQTIIVLNFLKTEQYGYSLLSILQENNIEIESGTLYPLLRRLESQGLLDSIWNTEESRPRKYYVINDTGKLVLDRLIKTWMEDQENMKRIVLGGLINND